VIDYDAPHRRKNPLTGEWVLVSPHRAKRPWQGALEALPKAGRPAYDPQCYLCPGNRRAGGLETPRYAGTYVFDNDFPALLRDTARESASTPPWKECESEAGLCRVVCYSPRHDLTLSDFGEDDMRGVVDTWAAQVVEIYEQPQIGYVQIFENKGEVMGCSNPHPHGQIWATSGLPNEVAKEDGQQARYLEEHGRCLLCDVLAHERQAGERLIIENEEWSVLVPFWAVWPFETLLVPRRHAASLPDLDGAQRQGLAGMWPKLLSRYDTLFGVTMPFSCGWHIAPKQAAARGSWHTHAHFYPPLLRSATVRKFMVGFEMLAGPQRDITPEQAAARLRALAM
jgi:UDPglucose--hexose-1-phosphate uridylyltransferase